MAADPIPTAKAATIPMGRLVPSAIPAAAPIPTTESPHVPERPGHVRGGHDDHRGGQRQPHRQVDGRRAGRGDRLEALRPVGPGEPSGDQREPDRERARKQLLEQQALAPVREEREGDEHQRPGDQQVIGELPEPAEEPGELLTRPVTSESIEVGPGAGKVSTTTVSTARASSTTSVGRRDRGASLADENRRMSRRHARLPARDGRSEPVGATARFAASPSPASSRVGLDERAARGGA